LILEQKQFASTYLPRAIRPAGHVAHLIPSVINNNIRPYQFSQHSMQIQGANIAVLSDGLNTYLVEHRLRARVCAPIRCNFDWSPSVCVSHHVRIWYSSPRVYAVSGLRLGKRGKKLRSTIKRWNMNQKLLFAQSLPNIIRVFYLFPTTKHRILILHTMCVRFYFIFFAKLCCWKF